jgi:hypothetical protein
MGMPGLPNFSLVVVPYGLSHPLKIELVTRRETRPRAEPVAAHRRAGSSIFIFGGVPLVRFYSLANNIFFARDGVRDPSPVVDRLGALGESRL